MSFTVQIEPSGHSFTVEEGESVLDAALRQGFAFPYGCRNGACGSCKGKVLAGEVEYLTPPPALHDEDPERGIAVFCQARPRGDLRIEVREIGAAKDIPVKTLPCRIAGLEQLNHDVMGVKLKLPVTERLQFLAGQYIDLLLRDGRRRSFSLANAPHDDAFLQLHVRRIEGGRFSEHLFTKAKEKDLLRIEGPLGSFFLREDSQRPMILVAGGTGFAPIKGMIEHAIAEGIERPIHLYWGARARRDLYRDELAATWAAAHENIRYTPVLSQPLAADDWRGRTGYVHEAVLEDFQDLSGFDVYASGPPPMVYAGRDAFATRGLDLEHYYSDAFEYAAD